MGISKIGEIHLNPFFLFFGESKMEEYKITFMYIREHFRKNTQTNWGKNQIINRIDLLEKQYDQNREK